MNKENERTLIGYGACKDLDQAMSEALKITQTVDLVLGPGSTEIDLHDTNDQLITRIRSLPKAQSGYTREFGDAWERMMARRAAREDRSQTSDA